jgi:glycosyltransferase involved in cell wall biosynthesis
MNQTRKKLLYLAMCDPDLPVNGVTVRMGAFVKYLGNYYDITLVNMTGAGHHVERSIQARYEHQCHGSGVIHRVSVPFSQAGYFLFSPKLYHQASELLQREKFDFLLVDYGLAAVYGNLLSSRYQIPLIYSSSNVEYRWYLSIAKKDPRRLLLAPYVYWAERKACETAKLVITVSEQDQKSYSKWIPTDKIIVIPQGFDPEQIHPTHQTLANSAPVIIFIGSFGDKNNLIAAEYIIEKIVPKVSKVFPEAKFQFIGSKPPENLKHKNVEWTGFVDDLEPYFQSANLLLAPMTYAPGISTKVALGLAYGKTVVATPQTLKTLSKSYRQLNSATLTDFPNKVLELLTNPPAPITEEEFELICQDFAWPSLMKQLFQKIEQRCVLENRVNSENITM